MPRVPGGPDAGEALITESLVRIISFTGSTAAGRRVDDEPNVPFGGVLGSGSGTRFGGTANLDAFTETRWVTMRGDIAPYPF
jgi:acyl-CoA reductase-like NAD-dependent aldehyde dehydrogenase